MLKLYGHPDSGHVYKVALALSLAKIPYDYERVDIWAPVESRSADFLAASRFAEVPCLIVDGQAKTQSGAILSWMARTFDVLGGATQHDAALEWVMWEANRIGMCVPQLIYRFKAPEAFNADSVAFLLSRYAVDIKRFDEQLGGNPFLLGEALTIADIAVFGYLHRYQKAGVSVPTNTKGWIHRIQSLPGFVSQSELL